MSLKKTLEMIFRNESGNEVMIQVANPKVDLTLAQVNAVMQDIVAKNIFSTTGGDLVQMVDAKIRVLEVTELV